MGKLLKSLVIGTATGLATAYFLSSEKGKEIKARAEKAFEAYKENPEEYHQMAKDKGQEYSHLAKETFYDYKQKFENGDITPEQVFETVKEKTNQFVKQASQTFADKSENTSETEVNLSEEDIIFDYTDPKEGVPIISQSELTSTEENLSSEISSKSEEVKSETNDLDNHF